MKVRAIYAGLAGILLLAAAVEGCGGDSADPATEKGTTWLAWGPSNDNTRFQAAERTLSVDNVSSLAVRWKTEVAGEVSATPIVDVDAVYVADWSGTLSRLNRSTGAVEWSHTVAEYTGIEKNSLRVSPVLDGEMLIFGDQGGRVGAGARMLAVHKQTGELAWTTVVDEHPAALVTQSATVHEGRVYVGISSVEELYAVSVPGYECCSFRGSMLALDVASGDILWKTPMIDDAAYAKGYRGNAIWGSQPTIDTKRGSVYVATGNNYDIPVSVRECVTRVLADDPMNEQAVRACVGTDNNYFDAIVSLDLRDGHVKWANPVLPFDAFTIACVFMPEVFADNCPPPAGPDYDFGQSPMLFSVGKDTKTRDLVGAGQKSGFFWALDAETGELAWKTKVGPGGHLGGSMWGSASDGKQLYVTISNLDYEAWPLQGNNEFAGTTVTKGFWSALDPATGAILWQTPDPNDVPPPAGGVGPGGGIVAPVTVANGVLYGASLAPAADATNMFALDTTNGKIVWSFAAGSSVNCAPSVVDGVLYWGSGYVGGALNLGTPGKTVFAFGLPVSE